MTARRGLYLLVGVSLVFFASWWNAYVPPTSGGEAVAMAPWAAHYLPYRDYFFQAPPGLPMLVQAISFIAGSHLLATLTFGVLLRIGEGCAVYVLLLRVARPSYAVLGTLTALFVSSTDISDTTFYYNHLGSALVVIGTLLGLRAAGGHRVRHYLAAVGAGALFVYAVAVKQTMIFGAATAFVALVLLVFPRPKAGWVRWVLGLATGATIAVGGIWAWLAAHGLVNAMMFVMRRAPEAKGGVVRSLFRPLSLLIDAPDAFLASVTAWIVIAIVAIVWTMHRRKKELPHAAYLLLGMLAVVCVGGLAAARGGRALTLFLTALGWWGSVTIVALHVPLLYERRAESSARALVALGILSFGIGYCFAVSWPLFEDIAFPGLAVVVAATLEYAPSARPGRWVAALVLLACASMALSVDRKFTSPHTWGGWIEPPIYSARGEFAHPAFAGMRISKASADLYTTVSQIAQRASKPGDPIYVFPDLPILYAIADRRPATYALAHWVDTCPDFLGKEDALRLRANPPKLLIVREDPMSLIEWEESVYLGGHRSSVRDIVSALDDIKPLYDKVASFTAAATSPIDFYVRRDSRAD